MKCLKLLSQSRLILRLALLMICTAFSNLTNADNFSGSFKNFVLGSPAEASTMAGRQSATNGQAAACMQCHDGTLAQAITLENSDMPMHLGRDRSDDHPVGMDYSRYASENPGSYLAPSALDRRIQLENGQVTCVSCHQLKDSATTAENNADPSLQTASDTTSGCTASKSLTTGTDQTRLCISCHVM